MDAILQLAVNGLSLGGIYAMVGIGFTLVFGVVNLINFAHTEFYMLGAYVLFGLFGILGLPYTLAAVLATISIGILGYVVRKVLNLNPNMRFDTMILLTMGLSIVFVNGALAVFSNAIQNAPTAASSEILRFGVVSISYQRLVIMVVAFLSIIAVDLVLRHTKTGKAMRAMAQNLEAAVVVGIDTGLISSVTFVVGGALAGLAGALVAPVYYIVPVMGIALLPKCFAIAIMGGRGNVRGALLAALGLGLIESYGAFYVGIGFRDLIAFLLLIGVLVVKPQGLFGEKVGLA